MKIKFETMGQVFKYVEAHYQYFGFNPRAIGLTKEEMLCIESSWGRHAFPNVEGYPPSVMGIPLVVLENDYED